MEPHHDPATARPVIEKRLFRIEEHLTASEEETSALGATFAERLHSGDWVGLTGSLGAGKSVFARAIGKAWGVTTPMPSPSYTLLNLYDGRCPVCHIDLYRLGSSDELDFAGLSGYFVDAGICLVEWPEKATDRWPNQGWLISFEVTGPEARKIVISRLRPVS
jgi:tRNA threonylcarbamoyl adenosine modification protein YjeE